MKKYYVVGLMSGTSFDGIDASLIYTDGLRTVKKLCQSSYRYRPQTTKEISKIISNKSYQYNKRYVENLITVDHFHALNKLIKNIKIKPDFVGFHGQTIYHNPERKTSIQLGSGKLLSKMCKTNVIYDFRSTDLKHGGQGAPLAPIYHKLLVEQWRLNLPSCILNIGGVSNITYWDGKNLIGFDTGPGNGLMDHILQNIKEISYDRDGLMARRGKPNFNLVDKYVNQDFFFKPPPKSLDKLTFLKIINDQNFKSLSLEDSISTLLEFSIKTIIISLRFFPKKIKSIVVVGGGSLNNFFMERLNQELSKMGIKLLFKTKESKYIEAEMIAYITIRSLKNLPITFPTTTGIKKSSSAGKKQLYVIS